MNLQPTDVALLLGFVNLVGLLTAAFIGKRPSADKRMEIAEAQDRDLSTENLGLRDRLDKAWADRDGYREKYMDEATESNRLQQDNDRLTSQLARLSEERDALKAERETLQSDKAALNAKLVEKDVQINRLLREAAGLGPENGHK